MCLEWTRPSSSSPLILPLSLRSIPPPSFPGRGCQRTEEVCLAQNATPVFVPTFRVVVLVRVIAFIPSLYDIIVYMGWLFLLIYFYYS